MHKTTPSAHRPRSLHLLVEGTGTTPPSSPPLSRSHPRRSSSISYKSPELEFNPTQILSLPLTLAERHSDLLHFIAQKEAKCLELRTQLAIHQAELLQLKRKWERIVHRRYGSDEKTMIEGIKECIQAIIRFLAADDDQMMVVSYTDSTPTLLFYH